MALHSRSRLLLHVAFPSRLADDLRTAASDRGMSPAQFVAQAAEALLATNRLPHVAPAVYAARMVHTGGVLPGDDKAPLPTLADDDPAPLSGLLPEDDIPPTLDDLAGLEDLG